MTLLNTLPPWWIGLWTLVGLKLPTQVVYEGVRALIRAGEFPDKIHWSKRGYIGNPRVYMQPRGIPKEFKPRNETNSSSSTIITGTVLQLQLQETSRMA